ncbi:MAG: MBL fold metallo-hydrolase [Phycisphaerales bacterium]|nr:MBL fold metallo-hydrolase [Phycisphaerales bacterium]
MNHHFSVVAAISVVACFTVLFGAGCSHFREAARGDAGFQTAFRFLPYKDASGHERANPPAERVYGPISSIGSVNVCAYVVETKEGLVVVDTGFDMYEDLLANNIRSLGLDPAKIKVILLTHFHFDHAGGVSRLLKLAPKAEVMVHERDADTVEAGKWKDRVGYPGVKVTRRLKDGDVVTVGGVSFKTVYTPGQSPGSVVYLATVDGPKGGGGPCRVCFGGDSTGFKANVVDLERLGYPGVCADYRATVEKFRKMEFDLYLGGHPHQVFNEARADGNPFITREEWLKLVNGRAQEYENFVKKNPKYLSW